MDKDIFALLTSSKLNEFWKRHEEEIVKEGLAIQYPIEAVLKLDNNNQERLVNYIFTEEKID